MFFSKFFLLTLALADKKTAVLSGLVSNPDGKDTGFSKNFGGHVEIMLSLDVNEDTIEAINHAVVSINNICLLPDNLYLRLLPRCFHKSSLSFDTSVKKDQSGWKGIFQDVIRGAGTVIGAFGYPLLAPIARESKDILQLQMGGAPQAFDAVLVFNDKKWPGTVFSFNLYVDIPKSFSKLKSHPTKSNIRNNYVDTTFSMFFVDDYSDDKNTASQNKFSPEIFLPSAETVEYVEDDENDVEDENDKTITIKEGEILSPPTPKATDNKITTKDKNKTVMEVHDMNNPTRFRKADENVKLIKPKPTKNRNDPVVKHCHTVHDDVKQRLIDFASMLSMNNCKNAMSQDDKNNVNIFVHRILYYLHYCTIHESLLADTKAVVLTLRNQYHCTSIPSMMTIILSIMDVI